MSERPVTRRRFLVASGASVAALAGPSTSALAQDDGVGDDITTPAIVPRNDAVTGEYTGMFVHLTERLDVEVDLDGIEDCGSAEWTPDRPLVFETQLVDQSGEETETVPSTIYLPNDLEVSAGQLFVINRQSDCNDQYIDVHVEELLAANRSRGYADVDTPGDGEDGGDGGSGAFGPGMGPLAAIAGLLAGAYGLARRRDD